MWLWYQYRLIYTQWYILFVSWIIWHHHELQFGWVSLHTIDLKPFYNVITIPFQTWEYISSIMRSVWHIWWRHQMETFSALLIICAGNSPVTDEFLAHRPVTRSFDVFFDLRLNKPLSKRSWGWWFEAPSCSLWRHCNENCRHHSCREHISRWNETYRLQTYWRVADPILILGGTPFRSTRQSLLLFCIFTRWYLFER